MEYALVKKDTAIKAGFKESLHRVLGNGEMILNGFELTNSKNIEGDTVAERVESLEGKYFPTFADLNKVISKIR